MYIYIPNSVEMINVLVRSEVPTSPDPSTVSEVGASETYLVELSTAKKPGSSHASILLDSSFVEMEYWAHKTARFRTKFY